MTRLQQSDFKLVQSQTFFSFLLFYFWCNYLFGLYILGYFQFGPRVFKNLYLVFIFLNLLWLWLSEGTVGTKITANL